MPTVYWYGNAAIKLAFEDCVLAFDPYFASDALEMPERYDVLRDVQAFLITHGHFDHVAHLAALCARYALQAYVPEALVPPLTRAFAFAPERLQPVRVQHAFALGETQLLPLLGAHVRFDTPLIAKTLWRVLSSPAESAAFIRRHGPTRYPLGECVVWLIERRGFRFLHFGSLAMAPNVSYPQHVDCLSLPVQGHSRIGDLAFETIRRLKPQRVLFHHFDDAFPPISQRIELGGLLERLRAAMPELTLIVPHLGQPIQL